MKQVADAQEEGLLKTGPMTQVTPAKSVLDDRPLVSERSAACSHAQWTKQS